MKFALASDLHLEFGELKIKNEENADVLVLAGDICVVADLMDVDDFSNYDKGSKSKRYHDFFQQACAEFPNVIYTAGNHEHYHGDYAFTYGILRDCLGYLENLHILDKETKTIDGVTFIGGTLWTDMNKEDETTMKVIAGLMNDFQCIVNAATRTKQKITKWKKDDKGQHELDEKGFLIQDGFEYVEKKTKFSPADSVEDYKSMMDLIRVTTEDKNDQKFVVVGHHAPSKQSIHKKYQHDNLTNGAYASDLDDFIVNHPQIKVWVHGHTHEHFDYIIGNTRVVCNPRGYVGYELRAENYKLKYIEV